MITIEKLLDGSMTALEVFEALGRMTQAQRDEFVRRSDAGEATKHIKKIAV